jgi:hypothetical protein
MSLYDFKGSSRPGVGTTEIILEKDDNEVPTKVARVGGEPVELKKEELESLEAQGYVFDSITKAEAEKRSEESEAQPVAPDTAGAAPKFANAGPASDQTTTDKS